MSRARQAAASFDRVLTIGWQSLTLHPGEFEILMAGRTAAAATIAAPPAG